ncbi:hypothetical protein H2248_010835, partial [Termitomyces sp. 'cryptogamus']
MGLGRERERVKEDILWHKFSASRDSELAIGSASVLVLRIVVEYRKPTGNKLGTPGVATFGTE